MIEVKPLQIGRLAELDGIVPARSSRTGIGNSSQQTTFLHWLLILAVALIATHVMWAPALLWGHSAWFDLTRMVEFDAAIRAGDYWPMWSPDQARPLPRIGGVIFREKSTRPRRRWTRTNSYSGPTLGQAAVFEIDHVIASGHVTGNDRHLS
jgi:hypothetical protein